MSCVIKSNLLWISALQGTVQRAVGAASAYNSRGLGVHVSDAGDSSSVDQQPHIYADHAFEVITSPEDRSTPYVGDS